MKKEDYGRILAKIDGEEFADVVEAMAYDLGQQSVDHSWNGSRKSAESCEVLGTLAGALAVTMRLHYQRFGVLGTEEGT